MSKKELDTVFKSGRRVPGRFFLMTYTKSPIEEPSKFAFIASKKLVKGAVDRNRLKRRSQAAAKPIKDRISNGFLLVLSIRDKKVDTVPIIEITKDLEDIVKKAKIPIS